MTAQTIGRLIRIARRRSSLSQAELASQLRTSQSSVSLWERNKSSPSATQFVELETALSVPLRSLEVVECLLPIVLEKLLFHGQIWNRSVNGRIRKQIPVDLAVECGEFLVATPLLVYLADRSRDGGELLTRWIRLAELSTASSAVGPVPDVERTNYETVAAVVNGRVRVETPPPDCISGDYLDTPIDDVSTTEGPLARHLASGVLRPIWPCDNSLPGPRISTATHVPRWPSESFQEQGPPNGGQCWVFQDPIHVTIIVLSSIDRYASLEIASCRIYESHGVMTLSFSTKCGFQWQGPLCRAVTASLSVLGYHVVRPTGSPTRWDTTVAAAIGRLISCNVLRPIGPKVELCEQLWSEIVRRPGHFLNGGEKRSRAHLRANLPFALGEA
jgi:transcriptional regulator with XRE-family HTH domain